MTISYFAQTPEYLLDTSVFRSLNEVSIKAILHNKSRHRLTASYYAPFELLSGILQLGSENEIELEYRRRRAALSRYDQLVGTNNTYWDDPHTMTMKAFGIQQANNDKIDFQVLIKACNSIREYRGTKPIY